MIDIIKSLENEKIVPVVKFDDISEVLPFAGALLEAGLNSIEITFRSDCAKDAISLVRRSYPNMLVAAGTVITKQQVDEAILAGAQFIVSPGIDSEITKYCIDKDMLIIPGCVNASEIQRALSLGLKAIKFFPAEQSGGIDTLNALCAPFSELKVMPTGGISPKNINKYLAHPNVIACGGSFMAPANLLKEKDIAGLTKLCKQAYSTVNPKKEVVELPKRVSPIEFSVKFSSDKKYDLVGLGEVLMRMSAPINERIASCSEFIKYTAGAELNVCAGAASLGLYSAMITKLPNNSVSDYIIKDMKSFGIDDKHVIFDEEKDARLGIYYFEGGATPRKPTVVYDRKYSSFTKLKFDDIDEDLFAEAKLFHTSGISLAVSNTTCEQVIEIMKRFKEKGAVISFDVNFRANLWSEEESYSAISSILPFVDILFISQESMRKMFRKKGELKDIMEEFCEEYNIAVVATTMREAISPKKHNFNAVIYSYAENKLYTQEAYNNVEIIDRIGSGDAFVSGALYGLIKHFDIKKSLSYGCALATYKMTMLGDLPICTLRDIDNIINEHDSDAPTSEMNR